MRYGLTLGGFVAGAVAGAFVGMASEEGARKVAARRSWCPRCGLHRTEVRLSTLFGQSTMTVEHAGGTYALLRPDNAAHDHAFRRIDDDVDPGARDALEREALRAELRELDALDQSPGLLGLLEDARQQDPSRARAFLQRLLDPSVHLPVTAAGVLDRPELPWADRWRLVDALGPAWTCDTRGVTLACRLAGNTPPVVAYNLTAGVGTNPSAPVDWRRWLPPGWMPTQTQSSTPTPTPPTQPSTTPTAGGGGNTPGGSAGATAPSAGGSDQALQAVGRARQAMSSGRLEEACGQWAQATMASSQHPSVRVLQGDLRSAVQDGLDQRILRGDCPGAQRLFRVCRERGLAVDDQSFGIACQRPR